MPKGVKGFQKGNKGGGRKKANHTIQAEAYRKRLIEKVIKKQDPIIEALITRALTGDIPAIKEIQERVLGRPKESLELSGTETFLEALREAKRIRNGA